MTQRRRRPTGFTLVELLVALVVVSIAMAIASGILVESLRVLAHSVSRARNPHLDLAVEQLRNDIFCAAAVPATPLLLWSELPLSLVDSSGLRRRWSLAGDRLLRDASTPGAPPEERPVLDRVIGFRWRTLPRGLLEVELVAELDLERYVRHASSPRIRPGERSLRTEHLLASPRRFSAGVPR